jgi:hypothetical protein
MVLPHACLGDGGGGGAATTRHPPPAPLELDLGRVRDAEVCLRGRIAGFDLAYDELGPRGQPLVLENSRLSSLLAEPFFARKLEALALAETDLDYFTRAGTARRARQLAEVTSGTGLRAHVGTVEHPSFQCRAGAGGDARWQRAAGRTLSFSRRKPSCLLSGRIAQSGSGARRRHFARAAHRLSCARPGASHVATGAAWRQFWK